jgi:hypothetical protein
MDFRVGFGASSALGLAHDASARASFSMFDIATKADR